MYYVRTMYYKENRCRPNYRHMKRERMTHLFVGKKTTVQAGCEPGKRRPVASVAIHSAKLTHGFEIDFYLWSKSFNTMLAM